MTEVKKKDKSKIKLLFLETLITDWNCVEYETDKD